MWPLNVQLSSTLVRLIWSFSFGVEDQYVWPKSYVGAICPPFATYQRPIKADSRLLLSQHNQHGSWHEDDRDARRKLIV